ncbi:MAG: DUF1957 domain-containing protein [Candidatus Lokiarchaeota archaeon]|nr:DUF1957 domain-containing protein [Candidatus Lokiarchaeota archaeon]
MIIRKLKIMTGIFSLMLHAHIPYCRKSGVWPAGEEWLFEAMHETYIPLLMMLRRFQRANYKPHIMIGVVPVLAEQLADAYMNDRFCEYMEDKIKRAQNDLERFGSTDKKKKVADYWLNHYTKIYQAYHELFFGNILGSLKWLQEEGIIEIITSAATHGFLPLMEYDSGIYSQIHIGLKTYRKYFDSKANGFWLPECAYRYKKDNRRAIDEWLADEGIRFFIVENIGIERATFIENKNHEKAPTTYRGYKLESGVCVFGRNYLTSKQVWSPKYGYPGDPYYLEFHSKDSQSGLRYNRITGTNDKEIYQPNLAKERINSHVLHFNSLVYEDVVNKSEEIKEAPPIILAPYDCELFGHWWHEGVEWIEKLYELFSGQTSVKTMTLNEYIDNYSDTFSTIRMKASTWGENGDFTVWNSPEHNWLWPYVNDCRRQLENVLQLIEDTGRNPLTKRDQRILKQACREILLIEGSDWPFLLYTNQAREYANKRWHNHHQRFNKLIWALKNLDESNRLNEDELRQMEDIDNPWPNIDYNDFKRIKR